MGKKRERKKKKTTKDRDMAENSGECSDLDAKRAEGAAIYGLF